MPATYAVDKEKRWVHTMMWGAVSRQELLFMVDKGVKDIELDPTFAEIIDLTEVTKMELSADEIREMAQKSMFSLHSRRAIVVGDNNGVLANARMYEILSMLQGETGIAIFQTLDEALDWVASTWTPQQALRVLKQQLTKLEFFKGKNNRNVENQEEEWVQLTQAAVINGLGSDGHKLKNVYSARSASVRNVSGVSESQRQQDYNERIARYEALLCSSIAEIEVTIPEAEMRGGCGAGDEWAFYKDLEDIMSTAKADIFIVDNYLNTEVLELYAATVRRGVAFRFLTDHLRGNLEAATRKYAASHSVELRIGSGVNDRHIFVGDRCWAVGQSIKDAAKKKPTHMVELSATLVPTMRKIYEVIWNKATVLV